MINDNEESETIEVEMITNKDLSHIVTLKGSRPIEAEEKLEKGKQSNTLYGGYDYFGEEYSEHDVHDVSTKYSRICPNCNSKDLYLLAADCGAWDWVLQQCRDCHYIFVYGWSAI